MSKRLIDMNQKVLNALPRPAKGEQGVEYPWKKNTRLRVLVTATSMRWIVRLGWKGKRYYESFGTYPEMKFADFEKSAYQFIADIQSGAYRKGSRLTVQQFFDEVALPYSIKHHRDHKTFVSRAKRVMAAPFFVGCDLCWWSCYRNICKFSKSLRREREETHLFRCDRGLNLLGHFLILMVLLLYWSLLAVQ